MSGAGFAGSTIGTTRSPATGDSPLPSDPRPTPSAYATPPSTSAAATANAIHRRRLTAGFAATITGARTSGTVDPPSAARAYSCTLAQSSCPGSRTSASRPATNARSRSIAPASAANSAPQNTDDPAVLSGKRDATTARSPARWIICAMLPR